MDGIHLSFVCGPAEKKLSSLIKQSTKIISSSSSSSSSYSPRGLRCVAVVDPPRSGLHGSVVKLLRNNEHIERIVMVSCSPSSLMRDMKALCAVTNKHSYPFIPVSLEVFDMFPHTPHQETVVVLDRSGDCTGNPRSFLVSGLSNEAKRELNKMKKEEE
ncbi:(Uracil-5)-methyltransferase family like protein, partial [Aduncisulcus paluster]